jgi:hypothetical protein
MARKKSSRKKTTRRRRVGGINAGNLVSNIAGVAVGAAAAGFITSKLLGKQSDTIKAVAAMGLGVLTPKFIKSDIGRAAGNGMIAVGTIALLKKSGFVSGLDDGIEVSMGELPVMAGGEDVMAGELPVIGEDVMAGYDEE